MKASYLFHNSFYPRPFSYAFFSSSKRAKSIKNYSKEGRQRCKSQIYESEDHIKENKLCDMIRMEWQGQGSRSLAGAPAKLQSMQTKNNQRLCHKFLLKSAIKLSRQ
jgi:hypothetical protein